MLLQMHDCFVFAGQVESFAILLKGFFMSCTLFCCSSTSRETERTSEERAVIAKTKSEASSTKTSEMKLRRKPCKTRKNKRNTLANSLENKESVQGQQQDTID